MEKFNFMETFNPFADVHYQHIKHNHRHGLRTPIILVNNAETFEHKDNSYYDSYWEKQINNHNGYHFYKIGTLDFWNEISGFFHSNSDHKVYDYTNGELEIPSDIQVEYREGHPTVIVAGTIMVDTDYNVYIIDGWYSSSGTLEQYLDFARIELKEK